MARRTFLTAEWRDLILFTYPIEAQVLAPHLPAGLEFDLWEGRTLVSLVGFRFLNTRVMSVPVAFHREFPEVNLRFYVRRGDRRGVVFLKEIVPRRAVSTLARLLYNENYVCLPMSADAETGVHAEYSWTLDGRRNRIAARTEGPASVPDSLENFLVEHHWGYTAQRGGGCIEYRVERPPWNTYPVTSYEMDVDVTATYGAEFAAALSATPLSVILADGSAVSVSFGDRI